MNRQRQIRAALADAAIFTLAGEICDELKGTSIYKQANKRKLNAVAEAIVEHEKNFVDNNFYDNGTVEEQFRVFQNIIESFKLALIEGPLESLPLLITGHKNFAEGKFIPTDEEEVPINVKAIVAKDAKNIIGAMRALNCTDNQIKQYFSDLVDKTEPVYTEKALQA